MRGHMKKILIFYGSYGGGHISAAKNIKEYLTSNYSDCSVAMVDCVEYINKFINKVTTGAYAFFSKHAHWIWKKVYNSSEDGVLSSFSSFMNKAASKKLGKLIKKCKPDIIISTHPFSSQMCAILKKKGTISCPVATVMTDYVEHSQWMILHEYIDFYFVAHDKMRESLIKKGVASEKVFATGIPFSSGFLSTHDKDKILNQYKLRNDKYTALFFAGGAFGFGKRKMIAMLKTIISSFPDLQIIAVSGKNKKLKKGFDSLVKETHSKDYVKILPFTKQVPQLMSIADFVITKPGGLTTTESLVSGLPMIIINPIPGQEEENASFVEKNNAGIWMKKDDHIETILDNLLSSKPVLQLMKDNAKSISKINATKDICETIYSAINNKENINV